MPSIITYLLCVKSIPRGAINDETGIAGTWSTPIVLFSCCITSTIIFSTLSANGSSIHDFLLKKTYKISVVVSSSSSYSNIVFPQSPKYALAFCSTAFSALYAVEKSSYSLCGDSYSKIRKKRLVNASFVPTSLMSCIYPSPSSLHLRFFSLDSSSRKIEICLSESAFRVILLNCKRIGEIFSQFANVAMILNCSSSERSIKFIGSISRILRYRPSTVSISPAQIFLIGIKSCTLSCFFLFIGIKTPFTQQKKNRNNYDSFIMYNLIISI